MTDPRRDSPDPPWLDEQQPHDEDASQAQIAALLDLLGSGPNDVLDLGCGAGRVLLPLADAGHSLTGIDRDEGTLASCKRKLDEAHRTAKLIHADFLDRDQFPRGRFNAVLCLGNTIMTIWEVDTAVKLLARAAEVLSPGGIIALDDCPADFWPELTDGNWQSGVSDDGHAQMIWCASDTVFTLRTGGNVDTESWEIGPDDRRLRLWSDGALQLAAKSAGLSVPERVNGGACCCCVR